MPESVRASQPDSVDIQIGLSRLVASTPPRPTPSASIIDDDDPFSGACRKNIREVAAAPASGHGLCNISVDGGEHKLSFQIDQLIQLQSGSNTIQPHCYDFSRQSRGSTVSARPLSPRWILNPETWPYRTWSCLLMLLLLYTAVVQPLRIAFAPAEQIFIPDVIVDIIFTLDIILSFVTAFGTDRGRLERDPRRVAVHYLKTYFVVDLISVVPFYALPNQHHTVFALRIPRFVKLLKLVRIIKMLQLYRFRSLLISLEYSPYVHQKFIRIAQLATIVMAFAHFLACAWYFVGVVGRDLQLGPGTSWLVRINHDTIDSQPIWYRYILSLYWALTTLTTVGYGDINAQTPGELIFAMLTMILGSTLFAYTTATVASMIRERDHQALRLREKMTALRQFTSKHRLSTRLRSALMKRMRRIWCAHGANEEAQMTELMGEMPADLSLRVTAELHRDLLDRSAFVQQFADQPSFVLSLFRQLLPLKLAQGEMLAHQGDPVRNWYIIESGELRSVHLKYPAMVTYAVYGFGQTLGDVGLFRLGTWQASVRCTANCRLWIVNAATFLSMVEYFGQRDRFVQLSRDKEQELRRAMTIADSNIASLESSMTASDLAMTVPAAIVAVNNQSAMMTFSATASTSKFKGKEHDAIDKLAAHLSQLAESLRLVQSQVQDLDTGFKQLKSSTQS